jgi:RimJ/RimL family protein N-acetyltransferase
LAWCVDEGHAGGRERSVLPLELDACRTRLAGEGHDLSHLWESTSFRWTVEEDGALVGSVSLRELNRRMLTAEIGYGVGARFRGRGLGTRAVALLVDRAFAQTGLRRLTALVHATNEPSPRLLARLGFVREGLLREHFLLQGEPADEVALGLLRREWRGPPPA